MLRRGDRTAFPARAPEAAVAGLIKVSRMLRWVFKPKHDQAALKEELLRIFGDKVLDDAATRLVIPSFVGATVSRSSTRRRIILTTKRTATKSSRMSRSVRLRHRLIILASKTTATL